MMSWSKNSRWRIGLNNISCWLALVSAIYVVLIKKQNIYHIWGAQWISGRVLDSRPRGRSFEPHRRHSVVSLSKNINPSLVLVQPRKTRPFITERLLMEHKESNQTNKTKIYHIWGRFPRWLCPYWTKYDVTSHMFPYPVLILRYIVVLYFMKILTICTLNSHLLTLKAHITKIHIQIRLLL